MCEVVKEEELEEEEEVAVENGALRPYFDLTLGGVDVAASNAAASASSQSTAQPTRQPSSQPWLLLGEGGAHLVFRPRCYDDDDITNDKEAKGGHEGMPLDQSLLLLAGISINSGGSICSGSDRSNSSTSSGQGGRSDLHAKTLATHPNIVMKVLKFRKSGITAASCKLHYEKIVTPWFSKKYIPKCIIKDLGDKEEEEEVEHATVVRGDQTTLTLDDRSSSSSDTRNSCNYKTCNNMSSYICGNTTENTYNSIISSKSGDNSPSTLFLQALISSCQDKRITSRKIKDISATPANFIIIEENAFSLASSPLSSSTTTISSNTTTLSVEIKVKCGLKSSCPFATSFSTIKKSLSRFQIMQLEKHGTITELSRLYNPCDLCSFNIRKIRQALVILFSIENKYLKCFSSSDSCSRNSLIDKIPLTPRLKNNSDSFAASGGSVKLSQKVLSRIKLTILLELISRILSVEDACVKLQQMQALDFIDVEGCYLVYTKVLDIFGGDNSRIDQEIAKKFSQEGYVTKLKMISSLVACGETSTAASSSPSASLIASILEINKFKGSQACDAGFLSEWIVGLSTDDCIDIIAMWLLALMAKDASVVVSLAPVFMSNSQEGFDITISSPSDDADNNVCKTSDAGKSFEDVDLSKYEFGDLGDIGDLMTTAAGAAAREEREERQEKEVKNIFEVLKIKYDKLRNSTTSSARLDEELGELASCLNYQVKVDAIERQSERSGGTIRASFKFKCFKTDNSDLFYNFHHQEEQHPNSGRAEEVQESGGKYAVLLVSVGVTMDYKVSLLDTGPKPLEKLPKKLLSESSLCEKISAIVSKSI